VAVLEAVISDRTRSSPCLAQLTYRSCSDLLSLDERKPASTRLTSFLSTLCHRLEDASSAVTSTTHTDRHYLQSTLLGCGGSLQANAVRSVMAVEWCTRPAVEGAVGLSSQI